MIGRGRGRAPLILSNGISGRLLELDRRLLGILAGGGLTPPLLLFLIGSRVFYCLSPNRPSPFARCKSIAALARARS